MLSIAYRQQRKVRRLKKDQNTRVRNEQSPPWVYIEELKIHRREWIKQMREMKEAELWNGAEREYVFHGGYGKPHYHSYPYRWWSRFTERRSLKKIRFHDLRPIYATLLIVAGASIKAIQKQLGHAKEQTTSNIYAHITKKLSRDAADKFNKFSPQNIQQLDTTKNPVPKSKTKGFLTVFSRPIKTRKTLDLQGFSVMICTGFEPVTPTLSK